MGLEFDIERRRALKLLGGAGITGVLGGCCSLGPPLARLNGVQMPVPKDVVPYLLPSEAQRTPVGFPCIDVCGGQVISDTTIGSRPAIFCS